MLLVITVMQTPLQNIMFNGHVTGSAAYFITPVLSTLTTIVLFTLISLLNFTALPLEKLHCGIHHVAKCVKKTLDLIDHHCR